VIVSDELRNKMFKPQSPEVGIWKKNVRRALPRKAKPISSMIIDKYVRKHVKGFSRAAGVKRKTPLEYWHRDGDGQTRQAW
jgi:hypothetical protein